MENPSVVFCLDKTLFSNWSCFVKACVEHNLIGGLGILLFRYYTS